MSGASARYSGLRIPVETSTPPRLVRTNCASLRSPAKPGNIRFAPFVLPLKTGPALLGSGFVGVGCAQGALRCLAIYAFAWGKVCCAALRGLSKPGPVCWAPVLLAWVVRKGRFAALRGLAICAFVWGKGRFAALRCLAGWGEGILFYVRTSPARGSRRRRFCS